MTELSKALSKLICVIKVKTGEEGKLFGAVTAGMIADEMKHQFDIALDKKKIHLEHAFRNTGEYEVELNLHPEVKGTLKVRVESTTPAIAVVEVPVEEKQHTEKRGKRHEAEKIPAAEAKHKGAKPEKVEKGEKPAKAHKAEKGRPGRKEGKGQSRISPGTFIKPRRFSPWLFFVMDSLPPQTMANPHASHVSRPSRSHSNLSEKLSVLFPRKWGLLAG